MSTTINKKDLVKIQELDKLANEKINAIQEQLREDLKSLGYVETVVGDYDDVHNVICREGQEELIYKKYEAGKAQDDKDYVYTKALQI